MRPSLPTMVLLPLGTLLQKGNYRLEQLLEHQIWTLTYEGTHLPSQQPVILQTLNPSGKAPDQIARQRNVFLQQGRAWQSLQHPHLEPIRDVFVQSVLPFLVKNKISEQTWATLKSDQPLSEAAAIAKITQIGRALALVHQHHLLHGEIRPENVMLSPKRHDPILRTMGWDFKATNLSASPPDHGYAAPEQYQGQPTIATDIYGLAATLYTLLTGQVPITALQRQHIRLELQHPGLSQTTGVAILRGMAMQPQHRPQSVSEWIELLPQEHVSSAESGNIGAVSPPLSGELSSQSAALEEPLSLRSLVCDPKDPNSKDIMVAPSSESTVPSPELTQTVSSPRLQSSLVAPRFPVRALIICSILSGAIGMGFGLLLRFHYQNQFARPQIPAKKLPVKNEPFLPKSRPTKRQVETFPIPAESPIESPTPSTLEEPVDNPPYDQEGVETTPPLQDPAPLTPETFDTESPNLETPPEAYPDSPGPDTSQSPDQPFPTPELTVPPSSAPQSDFQ